MTTQIREDAMTPGARLTATIEILVTVLQSRRAADAVLTEWARGHRFAGSSDRRAIEARVYTTLRRRNECANMMHGHVDPRSLALGSLALEGLSAAEIDALCTDGTHAPGALSVAERAALTHKNDATAGQWVRLNYPEWLHGELTKSLGSDMDAEMEAMQGRAALDLRANRLKTTRAEALKALAREGVDADISTISSDAIRLRDHPKLDAMDAYRSGLVEVQDAASQAVCEMLDAKPGERIVDLCAGAGGKSLALAAIMNNQGTILACDVDGKRLGRLAPRAVRCGATMIELTGDPYADHPHLMPGTADAVMVDAPCSGSGTWRRNPESRWTLDADRLAGYRAAQAQSLDRAIELVRPSGRVLYVTCSLLKSEGEDQVEAALTRSHGLQLTLQRRFSPVSTGTDGFFAAILTRSNT